MTRRDFLGMFAVVLVITLVLVGLSLWKHERSSAPVSHSGGMQPEAEPDQRARAAFIGDSFTAESGHWPTIVSRTQGWKEINLGRGATGYRSRPSALNAKKSCGRSSCPNFLEMASVAAKFEPDIVVVAGGRNDAGADINLASSMTMLQPYVDETFRSLRTALPSARIIAIQPMWSAGAYPKFLKDYSSVIRKSVEAVDGEYLEIGHPLGNRRDLIRPDKVHPTRQGDAVLAAAVLAALERSDGPR